MKAFHRDDLVTPQGCKKILDVRDDMTFEQLRLMRARMICEEFINEGSPREVNISKSMRECIQQRIDSNNISKVRIYFASNIPNPFRFGSTR